jgi:hypothetical protein
MEKATTRIVCFADNLKQADKGQTEPRFFTARLRRHFRKRAHEMGGGNYQTLIDDALREHIRRGGIEAAVRHAVRQELKDAGLKRAASIYSPSSRVPFRPSQSSAGESDES